MTPDIEQLCREALEDDRCATPGPWKAEKPSCLHWGVWAESLEPDVLWEIPRMPDDDRFIAAARTREPLLAKALLAERKEMERLRAEVERLRTTLAHSCTCSLADGAAPALRHEPTCELRIAKTKRIDPSLALSRFAAAMDSCDEVEELEAKLAGMTGERDDERVISQEWENKCDALEAKLAAMTAVRDEACDLAECIVGEPPARIAELRAVGKEQPCMLIRLTPLT